LAAASDGSGGTERRVILSAITQRKQAEQQAHRWAGIFQVVETAVADTSVADNTFLEVNDRSYRPFTSTP
jgi:hypothetical protein